MSKKTEGQMLLQLGWEDKGSTCSGKEEPGSWRWYTGQGQGWDGTPTVLTGRCDLGPASLPLSFSSYKMKELNR